MKQPKQLFTCQFSLNRLMDKSQPIPVSIEQEDEDDIKYILEEHVNKLLQDKNSEIKELEKIRIKIHANAMKKFAEKNSEIKELRKQLAEKDAEIEALKTKLQIRENLNRSVNREDI